MSEIFICIGCVSFWLDPVDLLLLPSVTEMSGVAHALAKAGAVEEDRNGCFRATVQYRGQDGRNAHLHGPRRV